MKQQKYFGQGAIKKLEDIFDQTNSKNIFLITGKASFEKSGAKEYFDGISHNYNFTRFSNFSSNPKNTEIDQGLQLFAKKNYDAIVAVGGGSAIDVAKAIKLFSFNSKQVPLIAVPTTAGSGSESTYFVVYYVGKEKQSKGDPNITLPNYSIVDPLLTMSLPKHIAASTGMDALGQAIESYWATYSTEKSKEFSKTAISLLINNLEQAVNSPSLQSKSNVMKAANLAGKAINISKTTACHAIAYPLTSYFKISHGHAVGLTLGEMLAYNACVTEKDCLDKRGVEYVKKSIGEINNLLGVSDSMWARDKIYMFMESIGLKTKLSELGIDKEEKEIIIKKGFAPERVANNPRQLTKESLRILLNNRT